MGQIKYPIGIQTFSEIRECGYVYVDKTEYLHKLIVSGSKYAFLSRPRRFGKSLFLSMIEEFFKGNRELFEGLAISGYDYDWQPRPVIHFDFSGCPVDSEDSMIAHLNYSLAQYERTYNINTDASIPIGVRFREIINQAHEQTGQQVVNSY